MDATKYSSCNVKLQSRLAVLLLSFVVIDALGGQKLGACDGRNAASRAFTIKEFVKVC
jgi:hypothetical protein